MGSGFSKQKKQNKMLQAQFAQMQAQAQSKEFTGTSPGGLVSITLNGNMEMLRIQIKPECVDKEEIDALQDLIQAAYEDVRQQADKAVEMPQLPGFSGF